MTNNLSAVERDQEVSRLNALIAKLHGDIADLHDQVEQLNTTDSEASYFADALDENISAPVAVEAAAVQDVAAEEPAAGVAIAQAAASGAEKLAIAASSDQVELIGDAADCLLPYQIYCDRLTFIKGIDSDAARLLASLGVTRFMDVAAFNAEDVAEVNGMLDAPGRISRQGWIEQAALLARGEMTLYALQIENGANDRTKSDSLANVVEVDFMAPRADKPSQDVVSNDAVSIEKVVSGGPVKVAPDMAASNKAAPDKAAPDKAASNKVIELSTARERKLVEAKPTGAKPKTARSWSVVAASLVLLGSIFVVGATMSGKLGSWHEAFQNMAGLLM